MQPTKQPRYNCASCKSLLPHLCLSPILPPAVAYSGVSQLPMPTSASRKVKVAPTVRGDTGRQSCSMYLQTARATLASGAVDINGALTVTRHSRHKQRLLDLLDPLLKLQEAKNLHIGLR